MKVLLSLIYCGVLVLSVLGQPTPQETTLFDAVDSPNCEDLLVRLDHFALKVAYGPPPAGGEIVFFPSAAPIASAKFEKFLKEYVIRQKLQDLISVRNAKPGGVIRVEFWVGTTATVNRQGETPLTRDLTMITKPILFDTDLLEMYFDQGRRRFVGVGCGCCISSLDWTLLSEFLDANRDLVPYVVIRGRRSRHAAIRSHLDREMTEAGFKAGKVKYLFANKNLIDPNNFSEIAVFMTSKNIESARHLRADMDERR